MKQAGTRCIVGMALAVVIVTAIVTTPQAAQAQAFTGPHQIIDGPGQGTIFNANNTIVNGGGLIGVIENHGGNCQGPHFHGTINGVGDPNPTGCGWGRVAPFISNPGNGTPGNGTPGNGNPGNGNGGSNGLSTREQLGNTADPRRDGSPPLPSFDSTRIASSVLISDIARAPRPELIGDIAPITASTTTNASPQAILPQVEQRLKEIFDRFKGTGDIAGVAEAIYEFNQWHIQQTGQPYYEWAGESKNYPNAPTSTSGDLDKFRLTPQLACYEFVHFCAFIASDQPIRPIVIKSAEFDENDNITVPAVVDPNRFSVFWNFPVGNARETVGNGASVADISTNESMTDARDNANAVQRGQIVTGIGRWSNNNLGYNHVGISIGNGQVITLGSGGLKKEALGGTVSGCFWSMGYNFVYAGDYEWKPGNDAPAKPTVSLTPSKAGP